MQAFWEFKDKFQTLKISFTLWKTVNCFFYFVRGLRASKMTMLELNVYFNWLLVFPGGSLQDSSMWWYNSALSVIRNLFYQIKYTLKCIFTWIMVENNALSKIPVDRLLLLHSLWHWSLLLRALEALLLANRNLTLLFHLLSRLAARAALT